jgi:hypothetical protein
MLEIIYANYNCLKYSLTQFNERGLISLPILRAIEKKYEENSSLMDSAFAAYEQCASKGTILLNLREARGKVIHK